MPIKGRVGRHANTGANCQNDVADQMWVVSLLNLIPPTDGGAGGSLDGDHVKAGVASDALYKAILGFQRRYFPTQVSGFVDPGGPVLARMEDLASRLGSVSSTPPPPGSSEQWGEFQSGSVQRALYKALAADTQLSHRAVVDILYATLDNGTLSTSEIADLKMVAEKSRTIPDRSKKMLNKFVEQAATANRRLGQYRLPTTEHVRSAEVVCDFLKKPGHGLWPRLDRDEVGVGILMRLAYPSLLKQGNANVCGPAAFMFELLQDHPASYAVYAVNIYDQQSARLRGLVISPSNSLRHATFSGVEPVDWLTMGSLRDDENWFLTFDSTENEVLVNLSAATTMYEMAWWFEKAGYSDVQQDADWVRHQRDTANMDKASELFSSGYRVCLLVDAPGNPPKLFPPKESGSAFLQDRHWIVLRSKIDRSGGNVKLTVYSWGDANVQLPKSGETLSVSDFLENYYGYVAAKP
jgi:hypothetical protein